MPAVRWFGGDGEGSAQETRTIEATEVVDIVRAIVGTEWIRDPDTEAPRPARAGDVAVLVRRHATARQLERCFDDAGLPLVVEARSLVFGTDEVRDLVNILTAIEDPNDAVAVVAALRHPSLGCSDADLLDWRLAGGGWWVPDDPEADLLAHRRRDGDADHVGAEHPVARALARLSRLRRGRVDRTVGGVVEHVIDDLELVALALARRRPRDRWRRLRFVVDQGHAFHAAGGHLRGFVRWLRQQEEEGVRAHEHVVADPDDDAVRVTTVHAAKGLEYPVVIVLGLDTGTDRAPHDPRLLWDPDGRPELNLGSDLKTAGYTRLLTGDDEVIGARTHHRHEEARLLYVATTRASDLLVVSLHHSSPSCHAAWLRERRDALGDQWSHQPGVTTIAAPDPVGSRATGVSAADVQAFRDRHERVVAAATRPRVVAATTIAGLLADRPPVDPDTDGERQLALPVDGAPTAAVAIDRPPAAGRPPPSVTRSAAPGADRDPGDGPGAGEDDDSPGVWRRGRAGSAVGRAVHAVLQSVDLATLADIDALARSQCAIEGLPLDDATLVADRARRAAEAPIVAEALAGGRTWRELHVGAPVRRPDGEALAVEGFVDLLVELPGDPGAHGDLVVVDWKTDATDGRDPAEVVARYRPQAATYALAIELALGRPVARCVFVLTGVADPGRRQVELTGDDLAAAVADLRAALAGFD